MIRRRKSFHIGLFARGSPGDEGWFGWELQIGFDHHVDAKGRPWRLILAGVFSHFWAAVGIAAQVSTVSGDPPG